jgi:hypothetical protein
MAIHYGRKKLQIEDSYKEVASGRVIIINHRNLYKNSQPYHSPDTISIHIHTMLSSLSLFVLVAVHLTSLSLAAPLPQSDVSINAPAGPPIRTAADLSAVLGDLVIPQAKHSNDTVTKLSKIRSPPPDSAALVKAIGDFRLPSTTTASSIAEAAK